MGRILYGIRLDL